MQKTKICHVAASHKRYDRRIFEKECQSLAKAGYDVTLLVADGKESEVINGVKIQSVDLSTGARWLGPGEWIIEGKRKKSKDVSIFNRISREFNTSKYMLKDAIEVDAEVYHIHEPVLLSLGVKLKALGKKVIFDSHEDTPMLLLDITWIPKIIKPFAYFLYRTYYYQVINKFDYIIGVTPHVTEKLKKINLNTELITNYPIVDYNQRNEVEKSYNLFGFAGGITQQWNHEIILDVLEKLDAKYELMGKASEDYLMNLKKHKAWDKVNYQGFLAHDEVEAKLLKCIAGIALASYSNNTNAKQGTLGNTKLFEYMMLGLPVICTDFVIWKQIVEAWDCGIYIPPDNVDALEEAMRYLLSNPDKAKEMGENGRQSVFKEFNWSIEEKKLIKLYKKILLQ